MVFDAKHPMNIKAQSDEIINLIFNLKGHWTRCFLAYCIHICAFFFSYIIFSQEQRFNDTDKNYDDKIMNFFVINILSVWVTDMVIVS
ncbi:hypothetical protein ALC53_14032 [Atta colombica]|uniref:Uncharacterized protein n=1 Tax=Atta colombica TaxID=520822 RepID=A0A195AUE4_9HYME|nr:hypothetical protein ALC53_14032 [Atta colombica]